MGYDMSWVNEGDSVATAEREAFPPGWMHNGTGSQEAVARYFALRRETGSYFRLNIWGMSEYRQAMTQRGMLAWNDAAPDFPEHGDYGVSEEEYAAWDGDDDDDDDVSPAMRAWLDAKKAWRGSDAGGVIAGHKLCSNDGWVVTPDEISRSLDAYAHWCNQQRAAHGDGWTDPMNSDEVEDGTSYWEKWLAFLDAAIDHGGVEVW